MYRFPIFVAALFILFFACTQNQTEQDNAGVNPDNSISDDAPVVPQTIEPQKPPLPNIKRVPQAPKTDLVYPKDFVQDGIPNFNNSTVDNNIMLDNDEGKYGRRVKLSAAGDFDQVMTFYAENLTKNAWSKNDYMDKTVEDEGIRYFRTNYVKGDFTLGLSIMDPGTGTVTITLIRKQN